MTNVENYTDDQLHKALRSYGLVIPITPNSRKVCENKLKKFMAGGDKTAVTPTAKVGITPTSKVAVTPTSKVAAVDTYKETAAAAVKTNTSKVGHSGDSTAFVHVNQISSSDSEPDEAEITVRELTTQEREMYRARSRDHATSINTNKDKDTSVGTSIWKYVGFFILAVVLVCFLVFLDQNAQNTSSL